MLVDVDAADRDEGHTLVLLGRASARTSPARLGLRDLAGLTLDAAVHADAGTEVGVEHEPGGSVLEAVGERAFGQALAVEDEDVGEPATVTVATGHGEPATTSLALVLGDEVELVVRVVDVGHAGDVAVECNDGHEKLVPFLGFTFRT